MKITIFLIVLQVVMKIMRLNKRMHVIFFFFFQLTLVLSLKVLRIEEAITTPYTTKL